MAAEGLDTTTSRAQGDWHIPQLVPRGLLRTNQVHHPVVLDGQRRSDDIQLRLADRITAFAGSMKFVSDSCGPFTVWMVFLESARGRH